MDSPNDGKGVTRAGEQASHLKLLLELGPLVLALIAYLVGGFYWATGVLMAAMVVAVVVARVTMGRTPGVMTATTLIVLVFGGLTLWLQDPRFIKLKPTIVNVAFGVLLLGGLALGRPLLKHLLGEAIQLREEGWRILTFRWALFFLALAAANELVWRNFSDGTWWTFKALIIPLTMVFFLLQWGLIQRYQATSEAATGADKTDKHAES